MSIYDKLADIQMELLDVVFEQKRGFHGEYMGLEVLTCKILPICHEHGIFYYFTANESHLILKIIDRETKEILSPAPHVRLPELGKDMKTEGGNYTYMKRYLLMNTFMVIAESFDPDDTQDGLPPEPKISVDIPSLYEDALNELRDVKGLSDEDIKFPAIRKQIFKMGSFNKTERDAIAKYCKDCWGA